LEGEKKAEDGSKGHYSGGKGHRPRDEEPSTRRIKACCLRGLAALGEKISLGAKMRKKKNILKEGVEGSLRRYRNRGVLEASTSPYVECGWHQKKERVSGETCHARSKDLGESSFFST